MTALTATFIYCQTTSGFERVSDNVLDGCSRMPLGRSRIDSEASEWQGDSCQCQSSIDSLSESNWIQILPAANGVQPIPQIEDRGF